MNIGFEICVNDPNTTVPIHRPDAAPNIDFSVAFHYIGGVPPAEIVSGRLAAKHEGIAMPKL